MNLSKKVIAVGDFKLLDDEKKAIMDVLEKGRISEGEKVREFEKKFAEYIGVKHCIATSSGTAALLLGLLALKYDKRYPKVRNGAKIITSPVTYVATSNAIMLSNMEPLYVDIDLRTFKLKTDQIRSLLELEDPREYAGILPVHLMGYPNDMDEINRIAEEYELFVFEDSAQAHGTTYDEQRTGSIGLLSDFSFYIAHNIQAGEMGCITTNDDSLSRLITQLKTNGRMCGCPICTRQKGVCPGLNTLGGLNEDYDPRFVHEYIGYNFKTMEFQAALGICQMMKADWIFKKRLQNVKYLNEKLKKYSDYFYLPILEDTVSYLAYPLVIKEDAEITRLWIRRELMKWGIENRPLFGCIPTQQPAYAHLREIYKEKLPVADYVGKMGFYIGCHQYLEKEDLDYIVNVFEEIMDGDKII